MNQLHFCSGLPRTGSTVLMNILQQNPEIFTTGTCALPGLIKDYVLVQSRYREAFQAMSTEQADNAIYGFVRAGTKGWFDGLTNKPVIISKNRDWPSIAHLYPESKIIVCVRDLRDIVESFEKVNNKIKALHTFGEQKALYACLTEEQKFDYHFNEPNALSISLNQDIPRLIEIYRNDRDRIAFFRYEDFLKEPHYTLRQIYNFLNLNYFNHDLNNIKQSELFEHDNAYFREKTDHKVKQNFVNWKEPVRKLSKEFHDNILMRYKKYYEDFYPEVINNEFN